MPAWMEDDLDQRRRAGLYRRRRRLQSGQGAEVRHRQGDSINFASNDYLAYAGDPRLARAAARAAARFGCGAGASPLVTGLLPPLAALERDLAAWEGTEAALVFPSGFQCHVGVVSSLASTGDALFSDVANHASLIDGCRLSRATVQVYHHNDLTHLGEQLRQHGGSARRRIIISDSLFSMDGDQADVAGLLHLAREFDALLILDEAHATGVLGAHGRGLTDTLAPSDARDDRLVKLGTLSKALGTQGGFVCGSEQLIDWLINHARPYIFSTALAPPLAAAARRAIFLVAKEPERRRHVLHLGHVLREKLTALGFNVGPSQSHIVPILIGDPREAVALSERLEQQHLLVPAIRPPSVPEGTSRLRISLTAGHTEEDLSRLVEALRSR